MCPESITCTRPDSDIRKVDCKQARISPATSTNSQRASKLVKRTTKQIAAQQLADARRKNADLLRQLQEANAYNKHLSEAAEAEVCHPNSDVVCSIIMTLYSL